MSRTPIFILMVAGIMSLLGTGISLAQPCEDTSLIYMANPTVQPCSMQTRMSIPVYINNPCPVGGFTAQIIISDSNYAWFDTSDHASADTIGSRVSNWESFGYAISRGAQAKITVTAIASMPPPNPNGNPYLPHGNGLLFTIHPHLSSYDVCNMGLPLVWGTVALSDTTGYNVPPISTQPGQINVLPGPCYENPRGDANCNGEMDGIDIVYLVRFFKGLGPSYCCKCSADANNSGQVDGIDITFILNYLKGRGPEPVPCH